MIAKKFALSLIALTSLVLLVSFSSAFTPLTFVGSNSFQAGNPGQTVSADFSINNTDNQSYSFSAPSNSWSFTPSTITLANGMITQFAANFIIPSNASAGNTPFYVTATAANGSSAQLQFNVPVNQLAALVLTSGQSISLTQNGTFTIQNTGNVPVNNIIFSGQGDFSVVFSAQNINLLPNQQQTIGFNLSGSLTNSKLSNQVLINATSSSPSVQSNTLSYSLNSPFCINGNVGNNLSVESDIVVHDNGQGTDTDWRPLDDITVKATVDNNGPTDLSSLSLVIGVFDTSNGADRTGRLNFLNDGDKKIDLGTIDSGNSKSSTFEFTLPSDMTEGSYNIVVKAYSRNTGEANLCSDTSSSPTSADVAREGQTSKYIAFDSAQLSSTQVTCGDTETLTFDAVNIGDDQSKVAIHVANSALGLDQEQDINNGLNFGDSQMMTFSFTIPQGTANGNYPVRVSADYDYNNGVYHQIDSGIVQNVPVSVIGCAAAPVNIAQISSSQQSQVSAGGSFNEVVSITNIGNSTATFVLDPTGYSSWGQLESISSKVVTLASGQSQDVTLSFNVNSGVSGAQSFSMAVTSNGQTQSQDIGVNIAASQSPFSFLSGNGLIWVIAAIILVLIILIIIFIVVLVRRR